MTRCNRSEVNLKSTAYNQNGQNYFEQLTAYNSMSSHLRRILLAKCVVDAKNKNYTRRRKQLCKDIDYKSECAKTEITDDIIDKLAYDTLHHPADFLKMSYNSGYLCERGDQKYFTDCYNYDMICSRSRLHNHVICSDSPLFKSNKFEPFIPNSQNTKRRSFTQSNYSKTYKPVDVKSAIKIQDIAQHRFRDNSIVYESASDFITQEVNRFSSTESSSRSYENYENTQELTNMSSNQRRPKKDEAKYSKFVYEITREIKRKGLYTDKELQAVFKKHLERNIHVLDKNKMLYEISRLKAALNVSDDEDSIDEEMEDAIRTQQLLSISELRPPTPPKILDENRLMGKLKCYERKAEAEQESETARRKMVVLMDANPELVVTERDILTSLIEADIDPEQAQKIFLKIFFKGKDASSQLQTKTNHSNSDCEQLCNEHNVDGHEKCCTTCDLITQEHKSIQVE